MEFKTDLELREFCIANAGKMATAVDADGNKRTGRLVGYRLTQKTRLVLIENTKLDQRKIPNPLPHIPYTDGMWCCVISPSHLGWPCMATTLDMVSTAGKAIIPPAPKDLPAPVIVSERKTPAACEHIECGGDSWCHIKYITKGIYQ